MNEPIHTPVLLKEIIHFLEIKKNDTIVDFTMGFGGHAKELIDKLNSTGRYIGIDQDINAINFCKAKFSTNKNVSIHHSNYNEFPSVLKKESITKLDKALIDLGVSSHQFDDITRGFSHRGDAILDMRMNTKIASTTAKDIINTYSKTDLSDLFYNFGELHQNKKLVENILYKRSQNSIETTQQLCELIKKSYYFNNNRKKLIKTYSQVFQALRIEVNQEFDVLQKTLSKLSNYVTKESIIAIITFHSLEDRLVKNFVKSSETLEFFPKKVIKPTYEERKKNARARSAKCRIIKIKT
jgi:16S rRNA (cytosine1402-N4)-methyltransferase